MGRRQHQGRRRWRRFNLATPVPDYNDQTITALATLPVYTGSAGWHEVSVDLTPYARQSVVVRWTLGTDSQSDPRGWYLDDVTITAWGGRWEHHSSGMVSSRAT